MAVEGAGEATLGGAGEAASVPATRVLAPAAFLVVHEACLCLVVTGEGLLEPAGGGEDARVILCTVVGVGEDADPGTLWKAGVIPTLTHGGVEDVILRAVIECGFRTLVLTKEEATHVVQVHLELVRFLASAFWRLAWVTNAASEVEVLEGAEVARATGLRVGRPVDTVDKCFTVSTHELTGAALTHEVQLGVGDKGPGRAWLAPLHLSGSHRNSKMCITAGHPDALERGAGRPVTGQ